MIRSPEQLVLTLCPWIRLHAQRGEKHCLRIANKRYSIISFKFDIWDFPKCSIDFFLEFTRYFKDRIVTIDEEVCEDCRKELDKEINTTIVDSGGIPPKE